MNVYYNIVFSTSAFIQKINLSEITDCFDEAFGIVAPYYKINYSLGVLRNEANNKIFITPCSSTRF